MRGKDYLWAGERVNCCAEVMRHVSNEAQLVQKKAAEFAPSVDCTKLAQALDNATMRLLCMDAWARRSDDSDALPFAGNQELFWRYVEEVRELTETLGKKVAAHRPSLYARLCAKEEAQPAMALAA
ncbi:MAG: hypothetical protein IKZ87_05950 [Actinomycetaceae bacterium]|nr:hypothetical protein [Actinomycetaceae bacterium]